MSKKKNNKKANKGNQKAKVQDIKNINKEAEEILNKLNEESKVENKVEAKKETTKENKPEAKKENKPEAKEEKKVEAKKETKKETKPEAKKETKKEAEEKLNEVNKSLQKNKKTNKNNTEWLVNKNEDLKISDKIMKIASSVWSLQLMMMNKKYEFELKHKRTKKDAIKVRIRNAKIDLKVKFKEEQDITYKTVEIKNENGKETEVKYNKDYLELDDNIIPLDVILMPVFDFYFENKKLKAKYVKYTEGNIKVQNDKITLDLNVRKEGYPIEVKDLSLDSLNELVKEDKDNILGASVEYFRRNIIIEEPEEEKDENKKEEKVEDKEEEKMTVADKIVAIIEDKDTNIKDKIMEDRFKNKFELVEEAMAKYPECYSLIKNILNDENTNFEELNILQITKENMNRLMNATLSDIEKYQMIFKENVKDIQAIVDNEDNTMAKATAIFNYLKESMHVEKERLEKIFKINTDEWVDYVFISKPNDRMLALVSNYIEKNIA